MGNTGSVGVHMRERQTNSSSFGCSRRRMLAVIYIDASVTSNNPLSLSPSLLSKPTVTRQFDVPL